MDSKKSGLLRFCEKVLIQEIRTFMFSPNKPCLKYPDFNGLIKVVIIRKYKRVFTTYSGSLKIRTRMCKGFWWKSGFFGKVLFGKNAKVRIFWTSPVLRKDKSPDFLEKCHFPKTQNYEFCTKTLDKLILNPFFKGSDFKKWRKQALQKSGLFGVRILSKPLY